MVGESCLAFNVVIQIRCIDIVGYVKGFMSLLACKLCTFFLFLFSYWFYWGREFGSVVTKYQSYKYKLYIVFHYFVSCVFISDQKLQQSLFEFMTSDLMQGLTLY